MATESLGERLKTWLEVVKLSGIVILVCIVVISPSIITDWCTRNGVKDCKAFGYKLTREEKEAISSVPSQLIDLKSEFDSVQNENERLQALIDEALPHVPAGLKAKLEQGLQGASNAIAGSEQAQAKLTDTLKIVSPAITKVQPNARSAVIFGGDKTLLSARDEIVRARAAGYSNAQIVFRRGVYRSVVIFDERNAAEEKLPDFVQLSHNKDAYLVSMNSWCPEFRSVSSTQSDLFDCGEEIVFDQSWAKAGYFLQLDDETRLNINKVNEQNVLVDVSDASNVKLQKDENLKIGDSFQIRKKNGIAYEVTLLNIKPKGFNRLTDAAVFKAKKL